MSRRVLMFKVIRRSQKDAEPIRVLYELNEAQESIFNEMVAALLANEGAGAHAQIMAAVEETAVSMLNGLRPLPTAHPSQHIMAAAFQPLSDAEVEALPMLGAPEEITHLVIDIDGRIVTYALDADQQICFRDLMAAVEDRNDEATRDEAWGVSQKLVSNLLTGRIKVRNDCGDFLLLRARGLFPILTRLERRQLQRTTNEEMAQYCYRPQ